MQLIKQIQEFISNHKNPLIVVLGPTASGKTAISLKIAHTIKGEIISTDSRQLYKGMDIGTDIILPKDQEGVPHHMLGIAEPDKIITLAEYTEKARKIIKEIYKRKHIPMLVGGTGLYISSIIEEYDVPRVPPNPDLRTKLEQEVKEKGPEFLHKKLEKLDPEAAESIHPNNTRYVIRALEVALAKSSENNRTAQKSINGNPKFDTLMIGIQWPREELYERVNQRVDNQVKRGLIDEVKALVEKGYDEDLPAMSSLGVKEIIPYIKGKLDLEECLEVLKQNTRHYAKRQMTWFRRYDSVEWLDGKDLEKILLQNE